MLIGEKAPATARRRTSARSRGTTTQRASVGELAPLDLAPSSTNPPQAIAAALGQREQQARQIETLSGRTALAMTKAEIAALKTTLDAASIDRKQRMLRSLATGLSSDAIARLAPELASNGPLAGGYALALSAYAVERPGQNVLADRILDGLDRMRAAGEGGKPVADTGPDWRRAYDEKIGGVLPYLGGNEAAALRTATAALYTQAMALTGKAGGPLDSDVLDNAVAAVMGDQSISPLNDGFGTRRPSNDASTAAATDGPSIVRVNAGSDDVQLAQQQKPQPKPTARPIQGKGGAQRSQGASTPGGAPEPKAKQDQQEAEKGRRQGIWDGIIRGSIFVDPDPRHRKEPLDDDWKSAINKIDPRFADWTVAAAKKYGIPEELLARVLFQESSYDKNTNIDPKTHKPKSGKPGGIPQMYPDAMKDIGLNTTTFDWTDAEAQINAGAAYLAKNYKIFKDWPKAVAGYHFGYPRITGWLNASSVDYDSLKDGEIEYQWKEMKAYLPYIFRGDPHAFSQSKGR